MKILKRILSAPETYFVAFFVGMFMYAMFSCITSVENTRKMARAYYYKAYLLQVENGVNRKPFDDAKVIEFLRITDEKQLREDLDFMRENYW
jgi:hypothetical protein